MAQVNRIRELFFEKGLKYAEISRVTGFDVKTVKKYIEQEDFNQAPRIPKLRSSKLDLYKKDIDTWLEEDKVARKKQRHTARRIYDRLVENYPEFDCSYRLVASYVAEKRQELYGESRFYVPLKHIPRASPGGVLPIHNRETSFLCQCRGADAEIQRRPSFYHAQPILASHQWHSSYRLLSRGNGIAEGRAEDQEVSHRR